MKLKFADKRLSGVLSVLPGGLYRFEDEVVNPDDAKARRLKKIIGYGTRRRVKGTTTVSELMLYGLRNLIDTGRLRREEIGALIVVTLSPDYFMPQVSSILHGELGLPEDVFCVDIPQACAGFVVGLIESFMLLEHLGDRKAVLCTGDIFNRRSREDEPKFAEPSFGGDIANITIIENSRGAGDIWCDSRNDGTKRDCLVIRDGGWKTPMTSETLTGQTSNIPCRGVDMDGTAVFNFVQTKVPPLLEELSGWAGIPMDSIDLFLFHQPNKFMLQKLATSLHIPYDKLPMELTSEYGNSNSGTIPAVMTSYVGQLLTAGEDKRCCFSGFGAGLSWAGILMNVGQLDFCENLESDL